MGFSAFRDHDAERLKSRKKTNGGSGAAAMDEDSDDDDDNNPLKKMEDAYEKVDRTTSGTEDPELQAELKAGIDRIRVCTTPRDPYIY